MTTSVTKHESLASNRDVRELIEAMVTAYATRAVPAPPHPDPEAKQQLDKLLKKPGTHRDGILILFAFVAATGSPVDFVRLDTGKIDGARGLAQWLATFLATLHIAATDDAFQTVAKGRKNYVSETNQAWQGLMLWASSQRAVAPVQTAWHYLAHGIAETARDLPPIPSFDTPRMTYGRLAALFQEMWDRPSAGAHEQFIWAALYAAYVEQLDGPGVVETKRLNASDASSKTAGDVQHKYRNEVLEAFEVTNRDWRSKMEPARKALQSHGLPRVHIVAGGVTPRSGEEIAAQAGDDDISVMEYRQASMTLVHLLKKPARREALRHLFDHLIEKQPQDQLIWDYVGRLEELGLAS